MPWQNMPEFLNLKNPEQKAVLLFHLIEKHALDPVHGGYIEALTKDWESPTRDFITPQDAKEIKKSMNTTSIFWKLIQPLQDIPPEEVW